MSGCPFCTLPASRIVDENQDGVAIRDAYPVSPGHTLIIPKRHVGSFFDLSSGEAHGLLQLLQRAQEELRRDHGPMASISASTTGGQRGRRCRICTFI